MIWIQSLSGDDNGFSSRVSKLRPAFGPLTQALDGFLNLYTKQPRDGIL